MSGSTTTDGGRGSMSGSPTRIDGGIHAFRFQGIDVVLDYTWFLIFLLVVAGLGSYYFPEEYPDIPQVRRWVLSVLAALLFFLSVLLHEFSHSLVARGRGMEIDRITLFVFGGVAQIRGEPPDARSEFLIAAAGPACSVLLGCGFLGLSALMSGVAGPAFEAVVWYLGYVNLLLVGFNLVPGFPLDGGRILRAILWYRTDDLRWSTRVVSNIGKGFAYLLMGLGFFALLGGLIGQGLFFIFIGMFLRQAAHSGYQQVALREGLSNVRVRQIMTADPVTVAAGISLQELVNEYLFRHQHVSFPVVRDGALVGLITIHDVKEVARDRWAGVAVEEAMTPLAESARVSPDADAFEALMTMLERDEGRMLVVEGEVLVGIVSRKDIFDFVEMRNELAG